MSSRKATRARNRARNQAGAEETKSKVDDESSPDPVRSKGLASIMRAVASGNEDDVEAVYRHYGDRILNMADKDGFTPLYVAAQNGHANVVVQLVDYGADIDQPNPIGYSALFVAAQMGHLNQAGQANVNMSDTNIGGTALYIAVQSGQSKNVHMLLEGRANPNMMNSQGGTALMSASHGGKLKIIKSLIDHGAAIDLQDAGGCNALIIAVQQGFVEVTNVLIDAGADINLHTRNGVTALIWAAHNRKTSIVKRLIECGADLDMADADDLTAFYIAAQKGYPEIVEMLLDAGCEHNLTNNKGVLATDMAKQMGHDDIVEIIKKARRSRNYDLLCQAVVDGDIPKVNELLPKSGGDLSKLDRYGQPALLFAIREANVDMVNELISCCASVNQVITPKHDHRMTLFSAAIEYGDIEVVRAIANAPGANLNFQLPPDNISYLHVAMRCNDAKMVEFLTYHNCSVNLRDSNGSTPFMEAVAAGKNATMFYMSPRVKYNMQDKDGNTALMIAIEKGQEEYAMNFASKTDLAILNKAGYNAIQLAAAQGMERVVSQLVKNTAPINSQDPEGYTPAHRVAEIGDAVSLDLLLRSRADFSILNQKGETVLDIINRKPKKNKAEMLRVLELERQRAEEELLEMYEEEQVKKGKKKKKKKPEPAPHPNELNPSLHGLICPITKEIMIDPVTAADGYTYQRENIEKWMEDNEFSPVTQMLFEHNELTFNQNVMNLLIDYTYGHGPVPGLPEPAPGENPFDIPLDEALKRAEEQEAEMKAAGEKKRQDRVARMQRNEAADRKEEEDKVAAEKAAAQEAADLAAAQLIAEEELASVKASKNAEVKAAKAEKAAVKAAAKAAAREQAIREQAEAEIAKQRALKEEKVRKKAEAETRRRKEADNEQRRLEEAERKASLEAERKLKLAAEEEQKRKAAAKKKQEQRAAEEEHKQKAAAKKAEARQKAELQAAEKKAQVLREDKARLEKQALAQAKAHQEKIRLEQQIEQEAQRQAEAQRLANAAKPEAANIPELEISSWDVQQVQTLLTNLDLQEYCATFEAEDIDGACLVDLEPQDLIEVGMEHFGEQRRLKNALDRMSQQQPAAFSSGVYRWSVQQVHEYLLQHGMKASADLCLKHRVNGDVLLSITREDIRTQLEVPTMKEKKALEKAIEALNQQVDTAAAPQVNKPNAEPANNATAALPKDQGSGLAAQNADKINILKEQLAEQQRVLAQLQSAKEADIAKQVDYTEGLCCPLSLEIMRDPVVAADGHTYERKAISAWLKNNNTSPMTREELAHKQLTPNQLAKTLVQEYLDENQ